VRSRWVHSRVFKSTHSSNTTNGREYESLRSHNIDILHVHDANRVIAFRRWHGSGEMLGVASLNNPPFAVGYIRNDRIADGEWREIVNSDDVAFSGSGLVNSGLLASQGGTFTALRSRPTVC
jgi:1,4-alpha-glucan branching enzyme